jgi:hypothetical protein
MNLTTLGFSPSEKKKQYSITTFTENGLAINILNDSDRFHKIPSGNFYKFGVIRDNEYFWFFNGVPVANSREKMREIYSAIVAVTKSPTDIPFVFKVKRL